MVSYYYYFYFLSFVFEVIKKGTNFETRENLETGNYGKEKASKSPLYTVILRHSSIVAFYYCQPLRESC